MPPETSGPVSTLHIATDPDAGVVRLRLTDEHGRQLGSNQVRLAEHQAALWQGLFDTRAFVRITISWSCRARTAGRRC